MTWDPLQPPPPGGQGPFIEYGTYRPPPMPPPMPPPWQGRAGAWAAPGPTPNAAPLSLWEAIKQLPKQYWRVITRPGAAVFQQEMGQARWDIIWVQVLGYSLLAAILGALAWLIIVGLLTAWLSSIPTQAGETNPSTLFGSILLLPIPFFALITFIIGVGGFFLGQGITYLLAKAFGGQGDFKTQAYTSQLYQVPIGIVTAALSLIPLAGSIGGLVGIYAYFLQYFQLMVVHRLSTGKAIAVIIIPVAAGIVLLIGIYAIYLYFIFSNINTFQTTPAAP